MSTRQGVPGVEPGDQRQGDRPIDHVPTEALETAAPERVSEPGWPRAEGGPIAFLLDASSALEHRLLTRWIERQAPSDSQPGSYEIIRIPA